MIAEQCKRYGCGNTVYNQERQTGRRREYCSDACRKAASRSQQTSEQHETERRFIARLRESWKQFNPAIQEKLEDLLKHNGPWAAHVATEAVMKANDIGKEQARQMYRAGFLAAQRLGPGAPLGEDDPWPSAHIL